MRDSSASPGVGLRDGNLDDNREPECPVCHGAATHRLGERNPIPYAVISICRGCGGVRPAPEPSAEFTAELLRFFLETESGGGGR